MRIRRLGPFAVAAAITALVGAGAAPTAATGATAVAVADGAFRAVTASPDGTTYVVSSNRVYRVGAGGSLVPFAGTGVRAYSGDGGPANDADLNGACALAADGAGNVYIGEDARIRRVDANGVISTVAGTGVRGWSGDGGPAAAAQVATPCALSMSEFGDLVVGDANAYRVRVLRRDGIIVFFPGTQSRPMNEVGMDRLGTVYTVTRNFNTTRIDQFDPGGFRADIFATNPACPRYPFIGYRGLVAEESLSLLIGTGNCIVRRHLNGLTSVVAGNGQSDLSGAGGPALDAGIGPSAPTVALPDGSLVALNESRIWRFDGMVDPSGPSEVFGGRAMVAEGQLDTGRRTGSAYSAEVGPAPIAAAAPAVVARGAGGTIDADGQRSRSVAYAAEVVVTLPDLPPIRLTGVRSEAVADCALSPASSVSIDSMTIGATTIRVGDQPLVLPLGNHVLYLNEITRTQAGWNVNALRVAQSGVDTVLIGHANAQASCR